MAKFQAGAEVNLVAGATFAKTDLYKFVAVNSSGHAVIGPTTAAGNIVGVLTSVTLTTAGAGSEPVSVWQLSAGPFSVRMAGSTRAAGQTIAASSNGFGIAPTTDQAALAIAIEGTSGTTGRIHYAVPIAASAADI